MTGKIKAKNNFMGKIDKLKEVIVSLICCRMISLNSNDIDLYNKKADI